MTPEEITRHFGKESLEKLYDVILENPVHKLADWILAYQTEQDIGKWLMILKQDEEK
jgi:hypothetical protein